jgi:hypothetical protein
MSDHKAPKTISEDTETEMVDDAHSQITWLAETYPDARPIDVLNAYLRAFNERIEPNP